MAADTFSLSIRKRIFGIIANAEYMLFENMKNY